MGIAQIFRQTMALVFVVAATGFAALVFADGDDVVVLTESTFEKEVGQDRGALVEFYAPWFAPSSLPLSPSPYTYII
jgi:hypothetical protein